LEKNGGSFVRIWSNGSESGPDAHSRHEGELALMFAGEYLCKVDEKGRFIVPSPIREQLESGGQSVVFLKGPEESILIYSMNEWEKVLERTKSTLDEEQSRLFMHFVVSEAGTSEIDRAGRILIPGKLRKLVPLDDDLEIILVGLYHRMEIWNPSEWRRYIARSEDRYEQNMAKILNLL
jgi:MraZ protein